jgi:Zn-dependent peptidase ImmA (M78 family)
MAPRFSLAKRQAAELLKRTRVLKAPVPVEKLAASLGAEIVLQWFDGEISGMVHRNRDGSAVIGVNSRHTSNRQRFTIAHEIGHLLLHTNEALHVDKNFPIGLRNSVSGTAADENEIEANQFAAAVLMPENLIEKDIQRFIGKDVLVAIAKLAKKYKVSEQAMSIRLSSLGYVDLGT